VAGRLQATRLVKPDLKRHITLALPRQGKLSPACRVVEQAILALGDTWRLPGRLGTVAK
jgi:hypothetical protein